jgi:hypothetical protein
VVQKNYYYFCSAILNVFEMMELIIKSDIGKEENGRFTSFSKIKKYRSRDKTDDENYVIGKYQ